MQLFLCRTVVKGMNYGVLDVGDMWNTGNKQPLLSAVPKD